MKIRKSVTKGIVFVLVFFSFFLFQGCGNLGKENVDSSNNLIQENSKEVLVSSSHVPNSSTKKENSLLYFSNDVSVVKVLHSNGGGQKSWNMVTIFPKSSLFSSSVLASALSYII